MYYQSVFFVCLFVWLRTLVNTIAVFFNSYKYASTIKILLNIQNITSVCDLNTSLPTSLFTYIIPLTFSQSDLHYVPLHASFIFSELLSANVVFSIAPC